MQPYPWESYSEEQRRFVLPDACVQEDDRSGSGRVRALVLEEVELEVAAPSDDSACSSLSIAVLLLLLEVRNPMGNVLLPVATPC